MDERTKTIINEVIAYYSANGIMGFGEDVGDYYVIFNFQKLKPKCGECGREME